MYIDSHAHLYLPHFESELDDIISRCKKSKVEKIFLPNIDLSTIPDLNLLVKRKPDMMYPLMGLHPCSVDKDYVSVLKQMEGLLSTESFFGVGETGIDLYWDKTFVAEQQESFRIQVNWARSLDVPVIIHSRESIDMTIKIIAEEQNGTLKGIFHCFTEDVERARKIIDLGFMIGLGGAITFKKNSDLREAISHIPLDHIVLETDAPYMTPAPHRGKRNESSYITYIAAQLAETKNISIEEVAEKTTKNAKEVFNIKD